MRLSLLALILSGCVYDADTPCGPAMTYDSATESCVCEPNSVPAGLGCTACASDEVVVGAQCGCASGLVKNAGNVCEHVAGLGEACSDSQACNTPDYPFCAPETQTCTRACASDTDC